MKMIYGFKWQLYPKFGFSYNSLCEKLEGLNFRTHYLILGWLQMKWDTFGKDNTNGI